MTTNFGINRIEKNPSKTQLRCAKVVYEAEGCEERSNPTEQSEAVYEVNC